MEDRIQINGVWYVKEQPDPKPEPHSVEVAHYQSIVYEDSDYCFTARMLIDPETQQPKYTIIGMDIEVVDKTKGKDWTTEYWDSEFFLRGCYERNPESIETLKESLNDTGVENFIAFLQHTVDNGWLHHSIKGKEIYLKGTYEDVDTFGK
jgi:hypothetical protein